MRYDIFKFIGVLTVLLLTLPVYAGPYEITFPIDEVTGKTHSEIEKIFEKKNIEILPNSLKVENGVIRFVTGGQSMESLLKLSDVSQVLREIGLEIKTKTWQLKEQIIGICLSTHYAIGEKVLDEAIQSFPDGEIKVLGTVLIGSQLCKILHLSSPIDYSDFEAHLAQSNVKINDLVWGHWKWGWGVEGGHHDRSHSFGAVTKP